MIVPIDRRGIGLLACGHGSVDLAQGTVPALLPFLIHSYGFSYTEASALLLASAVTSSLVQPIFGHLADRRALHWLLPAGVLIAGLGISLVGLAQTYWLTFALIAVAGFGAGIYHPEAARFANYVSGDRTASGMSLFAVGGNSGFALGPILITPLILIFGLAGTVFLFVPFVIFAVLLITHMRYLESFRPAGSPGGPRSPGGPEAAPSGGGGGGGGENWFGFTLATLIASLRSGVYFGLQAFVPSYLVVTFALSEGEANVSLIFLLVCGAFGTLTGGLLADRVGLKPIAITCMAVLPPLICLLLVTGPALSMVLMGVLGFFTVGTFSVTVVLGQRYLPGRIGFASGFTLGASIGAGGIFAALLGPVADSAGIEVVLLILAALPVLAVACAILLPDYRPRLSLAPSAS